MDYPKIGCTPSRSIQCVHPRLPQAAHCGSAVRTPPAPANQSARSVPVSRPHRYMALNHLPPPAEPYKCHQREDAQVWIIVLEEGICFQCFRTWVSYTTSKCSLPKPPCLFILAVPLKSIGQTKPGLLLLSWKQREYHFQGLYSLTTTN